MSRFIFVGGLDFFGFLPLLLHFEAILAQPLVSAERDLVLFVDLVHEVLDLFDLNGQ